ncbi:MAG: ribonuclease H-like YkuK family protein [Bacillota bacterium]
MHFISPTEGKLDFDETFRSIMGFIREVPEANYKVIIGSDSKQSQEATFVTTIVVYREGKGARFYYTKEVIDPKPTLRDKIYHETLKSLKVAGKVTEKISNQVVADLKIEVHLDIGKNGQTRELIKEVVGMVMGNGYEAKIKPAAYAASNVADRYTK